MPFAFSIAGPLDAPALAALQQVANQDLTRRFGHGFWSGVASERGILAQMRHAQRLMAHDGGVLAGSLQLQNKKPWAIEISYFTPVKKAIYLIAMAVHPAYQERGLGRLLIEEAVRMARTWPADSIRLDAFDCAAGAGEFYRKCGFADRGKATYRNTPLLYFEMLL